VEDVEIQVAPSLALLASRAPTRTDRPRLLLVGNPTPREPDFPALRYAPGEMTSIARHFAQEQVTAFQSERASPAAYVQAGPEQFTMIHFTAHATANVDSPLDSAVILSGPDTAHKLYARDIVSDTSKPLRAELVTVSACRSAGERAYSGEGLVGFAWAILRAGARRVVAGLWDVDDRLTADLMDRFYKGLADGVPPPAALRQAKLGLIAAGGMSVKPYYWGAFQMFTVTP
jgi:CHAT domain-containing protein